MWEWINNLWLELTNQFWGGTDNLNNLLGDGIGTSQILDDIFSYPEVMFYWTGVILTIVLLLILGIALFKWVFSFIFKCFRLD